MQMMVRDLMTNSPAKIHYKQSIDEAIKLMMASCSSEIFVVDSGNFLRGAVPEVEILKAEMNGVDGKAAIDTITSRSIATVTPDELVTVLLPRFRTGYCRQLAVIEQGKLIGQIQRRDVIRLMHTLRRLDININDISLNVNEMSANNQSTKNNNATPNNGSSSNQIPNPNFMKKMNTQNSSGLFSNMK